MVTPAAGHIVTSMYWDIVGTKMPSTGGSLFDVIPRRLVGGWDLHIIYAFSLVKAFAGIMLITPVAVCTCVVAVYVLFISASSHWKAREPNAHVIMGVGHS